MPVRGDVGDDAGIARPVRGEEPHLLPALPVGLVAEDDLGALETGQVPSLRGGGGGQGVRRGRVGRRRVRDVAGPRVDERTVDLVGEDPPAVPFHHAGQLGHLRLGEDPPERVVRVAEDDQVPAGPEGVLDRVQVQGEEAAVVAHLDLDDLAAEETRHGKERHVGGRGQDDRGARAGEVGDGDLQRLDHVRDVMDQRGIGVPAVAALLEFRARRGQLIGQERRQVAEVRVGRQPGNRVEDGRRGTEVHLRHGRAEPAGSRRRPLEAAAGAEHRRGRAVDRLSESSWHTVILPRADPCLDAGSRAAIA